MPIQELGSLGELSAAITASATLTCLDEPIRHGTKADRASAGIEPPRHSSERQARASAHPEFRRIWKGVAITFASLLLVPSVSAADRLANGFDAAPLADPIFTEEQVATEVARLNNWLIDNHAKLDPDRRQLVREGLYTLLGSHVSHRQKRGEPLLPAEDDLIMRSIFSWSEPLGVYGAHHIYNELIARSDVEGVPEMPALVPLPVGFEAALEDDLLSMRSTRGGWSFRIPYWFMPFAVSEFDTKNGPRTQLVMLSTGASKHEGLPGNSQSTLRLFAGPGQIGGDFEKYWSKALGFDSKSERRDLPIEGLSARKRFDEESRIHSEMVAWAGNNGPLVVYYAGAPGPYEKNRVHFIDFLRQLRGEAAPPPAAEAP